MVKALVEDTSTLARSQRSTEALVSGQQAQLQDTKEALLRSAQVWARAIKWGLCCRPARYLGSLCHQVLMAGMFAHCAASITSNS